MIEIKNKKDCCGCGTCEKACPKRAISMKPDRIGFLFPEIDTDICVECGICENICPVINHCNRENKEHKVFAAYSKDPQTRFEGSSGGMFGILAKNIISQNGKVYGAAFDNDLKLKCTSADTEEALAPLYKSKYLQSDLGDSFYEIERELKLGKKILFVSTPCQVYALKRYLKKDYENLLLVDFVCHGVPSQSFFDECKKFIEEKEQIKVLDFQFRTKKENGATPHYYTITYDKNGKHHKKVKLYVHSPFYYGFQKYITLRDSCYDCRFSHSNRCSDITIGDFHGIDKYIKGINRFDGVSTVVLNTEKGENVWETISGNVIYHDIDFETLYNNGELMRGGTQMPIGREEFIADLEALPFEQVFEKHLDGSKEYIKQIYYALPTFARKFLKNLIGM